MQIYEVSVEFWQEIEIDTSFNGVSLQEPSLILVRDNGFGVCRVGDTLFYIKFGVPFRTLQITGNFLHPFVKYYMQEDIGK
jgi:hypothetical protein